MNKFLIVLVSFLLLTAPAFAYYTEDGVRIDRNNILFEGTTDDAYETDVVVTDPTADRTITIPDASVDLTQIGGSVNVLLETEIDASSELLALMDDETGTGLLVFGTTPTLTTPVIGAATGTSLAVTSSITSSSTTTIGWSVVSGANAACSTTCTNACVLGFDNGAADAEALVDCADTTADVCVCAGANQFLTVFDTDFINGVRTPLNSGYPNPVLFPGESMQVQTKETLYKVASLDHAYQMGLFNGSMTRWELMDRVTKYNPSLRWYANATHRGLFDSNKFICGISHNLTIPKTSLSKYDKKFEKSLSWATPDGEVVKTETYNLDYEVDKILTVGWVSIIRSVLAKGYKVDLRGIEDVFLNYKF